MRQAAVRPTEEVAQDPAFAPFTAPPKAARDKALRILAKTLYRQLRSQGYEPREMVTLSTELLSLVTAEMHGDDD